MFPTIISPWPYQNFENLRKNVVQLQEKGAVEIKAYRDSPGRYGLHNIWHFFRSNYHKYLGSCFGFSYIVSLVEASSLEVFI